MAKQIKTIQKLDAATASKIAAGEVVDRPLNVIKELVENSVDAHATKITIELEAGGTQSIKITDNGDGIAFAELPLAVERFATS
ncbi:MAG: ATP-binding protein, partial [Deferribacteraceae bacterium]|nr:ATP-binding protein [Deferribacteraceae bacterium]